MDQQPADDPASKELRQLLLEVADTLEAVIVALQTDKQGGDIGFVMREAVHRVVQLRQHLQDLPPAPN
jgi:hypothetical protein